MRSSKKKPVKLNKEETVEQTDIARKESKFLVEKLGRFLEKTKEMEESPYLYSDSDDEQLQREYNELIMWAKREKTLLEKLLVDVKKLKKLGKLI